MWFRLTSSASVWIRYLLREGFKEMRIAVNVWLDWTYVMLIIPTGVTYISDQTDIRRHTLYK